MGRELGEVLGRRVREDDAVAREAGEADVRERRERLARSAHALERSQRRLQACTMVGADCDDVEVGEDIRSALRRHAAERVRVLVEGEEADDRKRRDAADGGDRGDELVEVVERLDREQVDATALEERGLLGEDRMPVLRRPPERTDGTRDEDVRSGDLPRVAGDLHGRLVDRGDLVFEEVLRQLAAVRAERVRLDDFRSRADEAEVERKDALRCAEVGLLRAAQTRNGARDQRAHASVGDERRPGAEAFHEAAHRAIPARRPAGARGQAARSTPPEGRVKHARVTPYGAESSTVRLAHGGGDAAVALPGREGEEPVPPRRSSPGTE